MNNSVRMFNRDITEIFSNLVSFKNKCWHIVVQFFGGKWRLLAEFDAVG